jgi:hypothetical protein
MESGPFHVVLAGLLRLIPHIPRQMNILRRPGCSGDITPSMANGPSSAIPG